KRWLTVPFAPGRAQRQLRVKRLPTHPNFWHQHVAVVVQEFFEARRRGKLERVEAGELKIRTKDRDPGFAIEVVRFPAAVRGRNWRVAGDIARDVQLVRTLVEMFTAELTTKGQPHTARWQREERGRVDARVKCRFLGYVIVLRMYPRKRDRRLI